MTVLLLPTRYKCENCRAVRYDVVYDTARTRQHHIR